MALTIRPVTEPSAWEWFLLKNSPEALFQSWLWGETLERSGAKIFRLGVYEGQDLRAIALATRVPARRGAFIHVRHGPVIAGMDTRVLRFTVTALIEFARKNSAVFVRMSPLVAQSADYLHQFRSLGCMPAAIHRMDGEYCWVLDLARPDEQILSGMRKATRYDIRRADKEGATVTSTRDPKLLKDFFALYEQTSKRHGFVPHTGIREEFTVFAKKNQAMLYLGSVGKKITAAAIVVYYGNQAIYHHGAWIQSGIPVSAAVQWAAIRDANARGMKVYNFWGIAPSNATKHPWWGITVFKTGFGGRTVEYLHAQDIPVSPVYWISRSIESVRKFVRGYD